MKNLERKKKAINNPEIGHLIQNEKGEKTTVCRDKLRKISFEIGRGGLLDVTGS